MEKWISLWLLCFLVGTVSAQKMETYLFAQRDTQNLYLDVYTPATSPKACIVYAFGGGFMTGSRNDSVMLPYFHSLQENGFVVVTFDYRLGLKGKKVNNLSIKPLEHAIQVAVEDLYAAVSYLIQHQQELQVDTAQMILMGSSAGAITVLQADYYLARQHSLAQILPPSFRFAGVVSFAGAIFSREGKVNYLQPPAPTFFLHGTNDRLVTYKKIQLFNLGFFGTNSLVKRFKKFNYPFLAHRYENHGHEIAAILEDALEPTLDFIHSMVLLRQQKQVDSYISDPTIPTPEWGSAKPTQLHKMAGD